MCIEKMLPDLNAPMESLKEFADVSAIITDLDGTIVTRGEEVFGQLKNIQKSEPGRKFCVKSDKYQSRKREQNKGSPKLGTAQLDSASPPEFRDGRRYARAA